MRLSQPGPLTFTALLLEKAISGQNITHTGRCDVQPISVYSVCFQEMRVGICVHSAAVCLFEQSAAPSEGGAALVSEIRADGSRKPAVRSNCSIVFFVSDC